MLYNVDASKLECLDRKWNGDSMKKKLQSKKFQKTEANSVKKITRVTHSKA